MGDPANSSHYCLVNRFEFRPDLPLRILSTGYSSPSNEAKNFFMLATGVLVPDLTNIISGNFIS